MYTYVTILYHGSATYGTRQILDGTRTKLLNDNIKLPHVYVRAYIRECFLNWEV